jgi:hypothetical protein
MRQRGGSVRHRPHDIGWVDADHDSFQRYDPFHYRYDRERRERW